MTLNLPRRAKVATNGLSYGASTYYRISLVAGNWSQTFEYHEDYLTGNVVTGVMIPSSNILLEGRIQEAVPSQMETCPSFAKLFPSIYSRLIHMVEWSRNQFRTSAVYISQKSGVGSRALAADMIPCIAPPRAWQVVHLSGPESSSISFIVPHFPHLADSGMKCLPCSCSHHHSHPPHGPSGIYSVGLPGVMMYALGGLAFPIIWWREKVWSRNIMPATAPQYRHLREIW